MNTAEHNRSHVRGKLREKHPEFSRELETIVLEMEKMMTKHLGYANYLTAMVVLWFDHNREHNDAVRGQAEYFRVVRDNSGEGYALARFAEWFQRYVRRSFEAVTLAADNSDSIASTFLEHGMTLVNWMELARKYLREES